MSNLLEMFSIVSDPVKIAWVLWLGWGIAQIGWYRRSRQHAAELRALSAAASLQTGVRRPTAQRPGGDRQPWEQPHETVRVQSPSDKDRQL